MQCNVQYHKLISELWIWDWQLRPERHNSNVTGTLVPPDFNMCCVLCCISLVLTLPTTYILRQSMIFYLIIPCVVAKKMVIISYYHLSVVDWWQHPTANYAAPYGRGIWSQVSKPVASQTDSDAPASDYTHHVWWHCEQEDIRLCVCNDQPWAGCRLPPSIQVSSHQWCGGRLAALFEWARFSCGSGFLLNSSQWDKYYIHLTYAPFLPSKVCLKLVKHKMCEFHNSTIFTHQIEVRIVMMYVRDKHAICNQHSYPCCVSCVCPHLTHFQITWYYRQLNIRWYEDTDSSIVMNTKSTQHAESHWK